MSNFLADTTSKIQPLSSSPPTFWPASVPPQPKSVASFGNMSSTQSYSTAREHQSIPGASPNNQGSWNGPPSGRSLLSYSMQDARYTPAPGTLPSPSIQDARYAPPGALPSSSSQDVRYLPPPGITVPSQSPQESSFGQPPGAPAYTNPNSGISLTRQELSELRNGKKNEKGDLVYFQPSFVDPNPWSGLKKASRRAVY